MGSVTFTIGSDTVATSYTDPSLPYPVVQYTSLTKATDTSNPVAQALDRVKTPSIVQFPAGIFEFVDFQYGVNNPSFSGLGYYNANVRGAIGADTVDNNGVHTNQTILRIKANTAGTTKTLYPNGIPVPNASGQTNNYEIIRFGVGTSVGNIPIYVSNLTIQATPQANLPFYNGLFLWYGQDSIIQYVLVQGIPSGPASNPGGTSSPPSETFGINDNHSNNTTMVWCEVDGRDPVTGVPVSSAGFGTNSCNGVHRFYCSAHDSMGGAGFTSFQNTNMDFHFCKSYNNAKAGFNFERLSGTLDLDNCTSTGNGHEVIIDSDQSSVITTFENWIGNVLGIIAIMIHKTYSWPPGTPNPQKQRPNANTTPAWAAPSDITITPASTVPNYISG